ncbi:hypothetical protein F4774DRAFT_192617 [Daldinia eschscholtzii]|nr:hypothetical protein F4774DRAFT_192617 [Daldinia eschscholtzii]
MNYPDNLQGAEGQTIYRFLSLRDGENVPSDVDHVSVLLFMRDIPTQSIGQLSAAVASVTAQRDHIAPFPDSLDFLPDNRQVNLYTNTDARGLLAEFDTTIQFIRRNAQAPAALLAEAFGPEAMRGMSLEDMISLAIKWSRYYFTLRTRYLEHGVSHDLRIGHREEEWQANIERSNIANKLIHTSSIETDVIWVNAPHIFADEVVGMNTADITRTFFEFLYRLTWTEAAGIVRIGAQRDHLGNKTYYGRMFSWIVYFINRFTNWKTTVNQALNRMHVPRGASRRNYQIREWETAGGGAIEGMYKLLHIINFFAFNDCQWCPIS